MKRVNDIDRSIEEYSKYVNTYKKYEHIKSILKYGKISKEMPDISVVIPTFHRVDTLKEALDSAIQDFAGLKVEVLVIENDYYEFENSKLGLILKEYNPEIVNYYQNEENIGMLGNWNRCFELARAPWVAMLHDDDLLAPNYYHKARILLDKAAKEKNLVLMKANTSAIEDGKIYERKGIKRKIVENCATKLLRIGKVGMDMLGPEKIGYFGACSCGSLMKRQAYLEGGGFDDSHYPSADAQYPAKLVTKGGYKVALTIGVLGYYRWADNASLGESVMIGWAEEYVKYVQYYKSRSILSRMLYHIFANEMSENQKDFIFKCLAESKRVEDKMQVRQTIERVLPTRKRLGKKFLYKNLFLVFWRIKQGIAILKK